MHKPKRDTRLYDHVGHEVTIQLHCYWCGKVKPLEAFGLRKARGTIRNFLMCGPCRYERRPPLSKRAYPANVKRRGRESHLNAIVRTEAIALRWPILRNHLT